MRVSVYNTFLILSEANIIQILCFKFCAAVKLPVHEEMCSGRTCNADG